MKKLNLTIALLAGLAVASLATTARADETNITGTAVCAKCKLHESDKCQTVLQTTEDGKTVNYYLTGKEAKEFHKNICQNDGEKVTVTGTVKEKDGKQMLAATKIEEVK